MLCLLSLKLRDLGPLLAFFGKSFKEVVLSSNRLGSFSFMLLLFDLLGPFAFRKLKFLRNRRLEGTVLQFVKQLKFFHMGLVVDFLLGFRVKAFNDGAASSGCVGLRLVCGGIEFRGV